MKLSRLYKCAIVLIFVILIASFSIEQVDAQRRRRRIECNSTGTVEVFVETDKILAFKKTYTMRMNGYCGVRESDCKYIGPDYGVLFINWRNTYKTDAVKIAEHLRRNPKYPKGGFAWMSISCKCQGKTKYQHSNELVVVSNQLILP